jgi:hypothetical protein
VVLGGFFTRGLVLKKNNSHLDEAEELEFGAARVISLFNPCFVPCSFPVRSLLQIGSFREENPENADAIEVCMPWWVTALAFIFPC